MLFGHDSPEEINAMPPILTKKVKQEMEAASGRLIMAADIFNDYQSEQSPPGPVWPLSKNEMRGPARREGIKVLVAIMAKRRDELREIYADSMRCLSQDKCEVELRFFSNYLVNLDKLAAVPLGELYEVVKKFDDEMEIFKYGLSNAEAVRQLEALYLQRAAEREELEKLQMAKEADERIRGNLLNTNNGAKMLAKLSRPQYSGDKRVANMVCEVRDLTTGISAQGRAGHQQSRNALATLLKTRSGLTTIVKISENPANTQVVSNTVNCAEWDALYKLLTANPTLNSIRGNGSQYSKLYFASAVPGAKGGLIPPCDNCKRLMDFLFAKAFGYTPTNQKSNVGE
jgi:hypothetical protein